MKTKKEKIIRLRAHHLNFLQLMYERPQEGPRIIKYKVMVMGARIYGTEEQRLILAERIIQISKTILQGQVRVKIVCQPDAICQKCRHEVTDDCRDSSSRIAALDKETAIEYGVDLDKIYTAAEIIEKLKEFQKRNWERRGNSINNF